MKNNKLLYTTALTCALGALVVLNISSPSAQTEGGPTDTSQAVQNANWAENVTITLNSDDQTFRFQSDGIPSHGFAEAYLIPNDPSTMPFSDDPADSFTTVNSSEFGPTEVDTTITTSPVYAQEPTQTTLGQIGVAISGARIFNDYEDMELTIVALDDNVIHDHAAFVDECNGHPLGDGTNYHYHGLPTCITDAIDQEGQHSFMIGVLADGFPAYGNKDENGQIVDKADLDACNGHFGPTPEFPNGIYHYHLQADEAPYSVDCYHGEIELAQRGRGEGPDLSGAAAELGLSLEELREALGTAGPPDFEAASEKLGISIDDLMSVLPAPPQR